MPNLTSALASIVLTVVLHDDHQMHHDPQVTRTSAQASWSTFLSEFPQSVVYADHSFEGALACWNATCAESGLHAACRLETAFRCTHERVREGGAPTPRWFVFTTQGTWWHAEGLVAELARAEALLRPARPETDVLLLGGGGLLTFAEFMVLSPPALRLLADRSFLDRCRARLLSCDPSVPRSGCKFKMHSVAGEPYMDNQLVHYCLAEPLARCSRPEGCSWLFGAPDAAHRDATAARRRYVSNAARRPPQSNLPSLLGLPTAGQGDLAAASADRCQLRAAMRELVAFGNAESPAGMEWLRDLRDSSRACADGAVGLSRRGAR